MSTLRDPRGILLELLKTGCISVPTQYSGGIVKGIEKELKELSIIERSVYDREIGEYCSTIELLTKEVF